MCGRELLDSTASEPMRGDALLDLLFTNRERLVGDMVVGSFLGQNDHKMVDFILGEIRTGVSKTADLYFWRTLNSSGNW